LDSLGLQGLHTEEEYADHYESVHGLTLTTSALGILVGLDGILEHSALGFSERVTSYLGMKSLQSLDIMKSYEGVAKEVGTARALEWERKVWEKMIRHS